jgi:hypothetical protein
MIQDFSIYHPPNTTWLLITMWLKYFLFHNSVERGHILYCEL